MDDVHPAWLYHRAIVLIKQVGIVDFKIIIWGIMNGG
jgi:hypothetical protein